MEGGGGGGGGRGFKNCAAEGGPDYDFAGGVILTIRTFFKAKNSIL